MTDRADFINVTTPYILITHPSAPFLYLCAVFQLSWHTKCMLIRMLNPCHDDPLACIQGFGKADHVTIIGEQLLCHVNIYKSTSTKAGIIVPMQNSFSASHCPFWSFPVIVYGVLARNEAKYFPALILHHFSINVKCFI